MQGEEAPIIKLVNVILMCAIQKGASDIHIEPYKKELRVRYRVDGILYNIMPPPVKFRDAGDSSAGTIDIAMPHATTVDPWRNDRFKRADTHPPRTSSPPSPLGMERHYYADPPTKTAQDGDR